MAAEGPPIDQGARNFALGVGAGAGATSATSDKPVLEVAAEKFANLILKPLGINVSEPQNVFSGMGSKGFTDNPILKSGLGLMREGSFFKKLLSGLTGGDSPVHKSENPSLTVNAPSLGEAPHTPDFAALLGDVSSLNKYSVVDMAGGPPASSNAPSLGGGEMMLS